ncbi:hypothetical protein GCM10010193_04920 [Kitasatospora atroaurantiaca]|uniref:Uncharacterized protein n=1 Tax=Kitasatospora atroaurantiaca TaxID=285545 RepID=A0A561EM61_9ACTN|nr:hypothetical protein [Kitasatospora atroaurantiaca]TWE16708.1 hypothetical protein FB465_1691 [Kitasatospora atroaurantiaca]
MQVRIGTLSRVRSVGGALRLAESALLAGGRRNAWTAVCENRRHAADREHGAALLGLAPEGSRRKA